jgi:hypothetical protein
MAWSYERVVKGGTAHGTLRIPRNTKGAQRAQYTLDAKPNRDNYPIGPHQELQAGLKAKYAGLSNPKFSMRVRCLGQKVLPCKHF